MKVLNLYAGIGGNRKLWQNVEVTAVEINPDIAKIYQEFYPDDTVIVGDAHKYLLEHYAEFDFIWSSPPCPSHSRLRKSIVDKGQNAPVYAEMTLYQEILFLQHFARGKYAIENVRPYYKPLIPANAELHRHLFWTNYYIPYAKFKKEKTPIEYITSSSTVYGFNIQKYNLNGHRKDQILRNLINPKVGAHVLNAAREQFPPIQTGLFAEIESKNTV